MWGRGVAGILGTMKPVCLALPLLFAIGLSGCDATRLANLRPGSSMATEVRALFGAPAAEWPNPDGSVTWEYPRGPEGTRTWMLTLDPRSVLQSIGQALTEENFARIQHGWRPEQVRRLLGKPSGTVRFPQKAEEVWEWRIAPLEPINSARFPVHFGPDGRVTGTSRREEAPVGGPDQN